MKNNRVVIGTRGSELALWQARWVQSLLQEAYAEVDFELSIIQTTGDKVLDTALSKIGDKGLFTKEIEQQLLDGSIDLAVHSLKDLPTSLPAGLCIGAVTAREDPADVLVSKNNLGLRQLPQGAVVLTGSVRRRAQLLGLRGDLEIRDVRGNVPTRLRKLDNSDAEAIILAGAGLKRLGLGNRIAERLEPVDFLPACGQGALAVEIRSDDNKIAELVRRLDDPDSRMTTSAERTVLAELEGGCQVPIGAYAECRDGDLFLKAMIADLSGSKIVTAEAAGSVIGTGDRVDIPTELGQRVARELIEKGGRGILANFRG